MRKVFTALQSCLNITALLLPESDGFESANSQTAKAAYPPVPRVAYSVVGWVSRSTATSRGPFARPLRASSADGRGGILARPGPRFQYAELILVSDTEPPWSCTSFDGYHWGYYYVYIMLISMLMLIDLSIRLQRKKLLNLRSIQRTVLQDIFICNNLKHSHSFSPSLLWTTRLDYYKTKK